MNRIIGMNWKNGLNRNGVSNKSKPWVAYNQANSILNEPASSASKSLTGGFGQKYSSFGVYGHAGEGKMTIGTKNIDGTGFLPTEGCKYISFDIYCGSTSYYQQSANHYLIGKSIDGIEETIATKYTSVNNWVMSNGTWKDTYEVSKYKSVRLYAISNYKNQNAWLGAQINRLEFHD